MIDEKIVNHILAELKKDGYDCFASEAQLRDAFAIKLGMSYDCIVIPEYTVSIPTGWRCYEKKLFFDLLIKDKQNGETILIEFKYKTDSGLFDLFNGTRVLLSPQSDSTNGRYAIWRDIYRIETFANINHIDKGFIVFITNNKTYFAVPKSNVSSAQFSIAPGMHPAGNRTWNLPDYTKSSSVEVTYRKDKLPLPYVNDYFFDYSVYSTIVDTTGKTHTFWQLVLPIYSTAYANKIESELKKMGKDVFLKFYDEFKKRDSSICKKVLTAKTKYTANAINTRTSAGIRMFKDGRNIEALRHIIASSRLNESTRKLAQEKLRKELV